jgi:transcription termination/antitermination protein NusA
MGRGKTLHQIRRHCLNESQDFIQINMDQVNLIDSFTEFKELKNIDRETMLGILIQVFQEMVAKKFDIEMEDEEFKNHFSVIINPDKGDLEIWHEREIVKDKDVENIVTQIALSEALKVEDDFEVGEDISTEITLADFGRRNVMAMRQSLQGKVMDLEKDALYTKYKERVGEIISAEVYQIWKREILLIDADDNELILPRDQQIPGDFFHKGDTIRAVLAEVEIRNNNPRILLSRTAPEFLERLFEQEVPEIYDGLITIKKIVRSPGDRAKVAVESYDDRIDPVGACVGMKGSRIHSIVRELKNENIDVINYTSNEQLMISRSLSPAKVSSIKIDGDRAAVYLEPDQVSLAIGKGGHNIKLAGRLTGYEIDVYREGETEIDDVELKEFSDEIEAWVIEEFAKIGCDTARSVMNLSQEDLVKRTDLEEETIADVLRILKEELEA